MDKCAGHLGMEGGRCGDAVAVLASTLPGASPFPPGLPSSLTASWGGDGGRAERNSVATS